MDKKTYYVPHEAWINGVHKNGGSHVELNKDEAEYLLMAGTITVPETDEEKAAKAQAKKDEAETKRIAADSGPAEVQTGKPADAAVEASIEGRSRRGGRAGAED